ncbi:MAG: hypothetical protein JW750_02715 [Anaerolineaceae bacterium]|nr:hypothetical protein [Anaerolineaceae bacterium]
MNHHNPERQENAASVFCGKRSAGTRHDRPLIECVSAINQLKDLAILLNQSCQMAVESIGYLSTRRGLARFGAGSGPGYGARLRHD